MKAAHPGLWRPIKPTWGPDVATMRVSVDGSTYDIPRDCDAIKSRFEGPFRVCYFRYKGRVHVLSALGQRVETEAESIFRAENWDTI